MRARGARAGGMDGYAAHGSILSSVDKIWFDGALYAASRGSINPLARVKITKTIDAQLGS